MDEQKPVFIKAMDHKNVYANIVVVRSWLTDFLVDFGITDRSTPAGEPPVIEQLVGVFLSPSEAKMLANILMSEVRAYERSFGLIPEPPPPPPAAEPIGPASGEGPVLQ